MGVHWKIRFLGECMKNQFIGLNCQKKEGLDSLEGAWQKRRGDGFEGRGGEWDPNAYWVGGAFLFTQMFISSNIVTQYYY